MKLKKHKRIKKPITLKKQCDLLWTECIKARAGYRSELSRVEGKKIGGVAILCSHHILGKSTYRLRYELDNGICLENGKEHIFGVHNHSPVIARDYYRRIVDYIGFKKYEKLLFLKSLKFSKTDLTMVKILLKTELSKLLKKELKMVEIVRYSLNGAGGYNTGLIEEEKNEYGEWVKYEDLKTKEIWEQLSESLCKEGIEWEWMHNKIIDIFAESKKKS